MSVKPETKLITQKNAGAEWTQEAVEPALAVFFCAIHLVSYIFLTIYIEATIKFISFRLLKL